VSYCSPPIIPRATGLGKDDGRFANADIRQMGWRSALMLLTAVAAAGCDPAARPPPPYFAIPPVSAAPTPSETEGAPAARPLINNRNPEVQYFLPSRPDEVERGPAPVPEPGRSAGPFYTPPYSGPVTGYGPGGMAQPPGAPPNPPYPLGGLMH
jgi:hypothetical protein